ncbi:CLUMA_CG004143, isoform A [Clunio marinus]|uniref:CLUMA_CG004143, isoform A n=1 Tax=Clunio marinus TaxID=568069 RepID=A0A1J1HQW0_9DIPT|nr:CLUMA_CG004143, isoform A [Clunio marinus]
MDEFLHYERLAQGSDNNATPPGLNLARTGEYLNNLRLEDLKRRKLTKRYEDALSNPNNFILTSPSSPGTAAASNAAQSPRDLCLNAGTKRDQLIDNLRSPPPFLSRNRKAREQLSPFYQSPPVKLSRREKYKKALLNDFNQRAQNNVKFVDNLTSPPPFLSRNRRAREQLSPYYQSPPAQTRPEFMQFSPGGPFMNFSPTIQQTPSRHTPSGPRVNYSPRAVPSTKKIRKTLRFTDETRNNAHQNLTPPSISITPPNRPPCSPKYRTPTRRTVDEDLIEFNPLHPCMPAPKPPSLPSPLRPVPVNMVIQRHQDDNSAQNQVREPIRQVPVNVQRDQGQNRAQNQERKVIREITINVQRDQDQNIVQNQVRETFRQVPVNVDVQRDQGHNRAQNQMPEPIRPFNDNEREFLIRRLVMNGVNQLRAAQMVLGGKK